MQTINLILENIPSFLKELGNGFTFVDNEYKIKVGDRYNYIDLLDRYEQNYPLLDYEKKLLKVGFKKLFGLDYEKQLKKMN